MVGEMEEDEIRYLWLHQDRSTDELRVCFSLILF